MSKCIISSRVSTTRREYGQIDNIVGLARSCGNKEEDGMFFVEEKEYGIMLSEEVCLGLNRVETLIESDKSIDCLFASEANGLARTKKTLFNRSGLLTTFSS